MKKLLALTLATILALSLTMLAVAELQIVEPKMPLADPPEKFTAMISQHSLDTGDVSSKTVYVEREALTGVQIEWTSVPSTSKAERIATTFASNELPDMFVQMLDNAQVLTYGLAGALLPISDYLEYMPNFSSILENIPGVKSMITMPDGKIYGIPNINMYSVWPGNGTYIKSTVFVNREWLNKLGLEVPTTTDELADVLRAFKDKDPNGNGMADEIPLSFIYNGWSETPQSLLYGPFGIIGHANHMNVEDGKCFYAIQDPRYIEAAKYIRGLWDEGLIDSEAFTQDAKRYYAKGRDEVNVYGVFIDWIGFSAVGQEKIEGADGLLGTEDDVYIAIPPLKGPDGTTIWANESAGIFTNRLNIASTARNPELLCRWADSLFAPDASIQEIWGKFGTHTTKNEDGSWTRLMAPEGTEADVFLLATTTRALPALMTDEMVANFTLKFPDGRTTSKTGDTKYIMSSLYAPYSVKEYLPPVILSEEANERIAVLMTPLKNAMVEQEVAWLTGQGNIENEYDAFIAKLESMGLLEVVQIYQDALDALK